jgi:amino acid transporter
VASITRPTGKVLGVFGLVMINVIAVNSLRSLTISAEYGFTLIAYYLLASVLFFVPSALIAAELATGWPEKGGVYIWVREAFGKKIAFLAIWLQWIYNIVWYPTILAFIAATFAYLINPALAHNQTFMLITVLVIYWTTTLINCFGMRASSWMSTIGALLGTLLPICLVILLGIIWLSTGHTLQIEISAKNLLPDLSNWGNLGFLTALLFGLAGMEMSAVHAEDVRNPQRDYPKALFYSTVIIFISLVLGSLAVAMVVPNKELSLVAGVMDAFAIFLNAYHLGWALPLVALFIVIGGVCSVSTWSFGPTKGLLVAAYDGVFPPALLHVNRFGAPVTILITQAIIFTILCSVFVLFPTVNSSYWILTALTSQLALLFYMLLFATAIKLRYKYPNQPRAYRLPGGNIWMWSVAGMGIFACFATLLLGFLPPQQLQLGKIGWYELILLGGMLIVGSSAFVVIKLGKKKP